MYIIVQDTRSTSGDTVRKVYSLMEETLSNYPEGTFTIRSPTPPRFREEDLWFIRVQSQKEARRISRAMSILPLLYVLRASQVEVQPVRSLLFKLRCQRLRPPERYFVKKYRKKRRR